MLSVNPFTTTDGGVSVIMPESGIAATWRR
jgi:hypothetical protein